MLSVKISLYCILKRQLKYHKNSLNYENYKVNYINAINFTNLFDTLRDQTNQKNEAESKKMGLQFNPVNFHGCILFVYSQNAYDSLILDHL